MLNVDPCQYDSLFTMHTGCQNQLKYIPEGLKHVVLSQIVRTSAFYHGIRRGKVGLRLGSCMKAEVTVRNANKKIGP